MVAGSLSSSGLRNCGQQLLVGLSVSPSGFPGGGAKLQASACTRACMPPSMRSSAWLSLSQFRLHNIVVCCETHTSTSESTLPCPPVRPPRAAVWPLRQSRKPRPALRHLLLVLPKFRPRLHCSTFFFASTRPALVSTQLLRTIS